MSLGSVTAMEQYPYFDPQKGYQIKNDARPWFDGKDYPFFREMYDGKNLKPQEEGSYIKYPKKSVPVNPKPSTNIMKARAKGKITSVTIFIKK